MPLQQRTPHSSHRRYTLYTAVLACAMMLGIYLLLRVWPFGDGTVVTGDLGGLYQNFFAHQKRALLGQAGFAYGFDKGLGGNLLGLFAYYYASPVNWLYLLFPLQWFPVGAAVVLAVKVVLACVCCQLFLARRSPQLGAGGVALALCYGFMAYSFAYAQNIMWHDVLVLLPLICLGILRLVQGGSFLPYTAALAVAIFANFYIAYMACLFAVVYFLYEMLLRPRRHQGLAAWRRPVAGFAAGSLLAGGLNAALLLPALANINQNKGSLLSLSFSLQPYFPLVRLPERLLWGSFDASDVWGQLPFIYCGMLVVLLVLCFFVSRAVSLKEKLLSGAVLLLFILSFWLRGPDTIWHGLKEPIWFPGRYAFIFCFFMVLVAARGLQLGAAARRELLFAGGGLAVVLLLMAAFPIAISRKRILLSLLLAAGFWLLLWLLGRWPQPQRRRLLAAALALAAAVELSANAWFITRQFDQYSLQDYQTYVQRAGGTVQAVQAADGDAWRLAENHFRTLNDPMLLGYWGISHFASTQDGYAQGVLYNLGFRNYAAAGPYLFGGTAFADSVLGIRYLTSDGSRGVPSHWRQSDIAATLLVLENPHALPMAFGVAAGPEDPPRTGAYEADTFAYQNDFYTALGGQGVLFAPAKAQLAMPNGQRLPIQGQLPPGGEYRLVAQAAGRHYAYLEADRTLLLPMQVNGSYTEAYFSPVYAGVVDLGWLEAGQEATLRWDADEEVNITLARFARLDEDKLVALAAAARENAGSFTMKDGYVQGSITAQNGVDTLYTAIPWDDDWHCEVNGRVVEARRFMGGLLAVPLDEGDNQVVLRFVPGGLVAGGVISGVALLLLAAAVVWQWRRGRAARRRQNADAT